MAKIEEITTLFDKKLTQLKTDLTKDLTTSIKEELLPIIKQEVTTQIKPLSDNLSQMSSDQRILRHDFQALSSTVADMQSQINRHPPLQRKPELQDKLQSILNNSRRKITIGPIDQEQCEQFSEGIYNPNKALFLAVAQDYFKTKMRIPPDIIANLNIINASPMITKYEDLDNFKKLSIEFETVKMCEDVKHYSRNLPSECRLNIHVHQAYSERFRALSQLAYNLRTDENKQKTMIKYNSTRLILLSKKSTFDRWTEVTTDELPGPDLALLDNSPPAHNKRDRPPSSEVTPPQTKSARNNEDFQPTEKSKSILTGGPISSPVLSLDKGLFTEVQFSTPERPQIHESKSTSDIRNSFGYSESSTKQNQKGGGIQSKIPFVPKDSNKPQPVPSKN